MALIINADIPTKGCTNCKLKSHFEANPWTYWDDCFVTGKEITEHYKANTRPSDCPILGEIPDEHGDLIERSKVHEAIKQAYCLEDVPSIVDQLVPTVLEASTNKEESK